VIEGVKMEEENINKETIIKNKELTSSALRWLTEEYPEKFDEKIHWSSIVNGEEIILMGNFDILEVETYKKDIEIEGKKKTYTIILKPLKKD